MRAGGRLRRLVGKGWPIHPETACRASVYPSPHLSVHPPFSTNSLRDGALRATSRRKCLGVEPIQAAFGVQTIIRSLACGPCAPEGARPSGSRCRLNSWGHCNAICRARLVNYPSRNRPRRAACAARAVTRQRQCALLRTTSPVSGRSRTSRARLSERRGPT